MRQFISLKNLSRDNILKLIELIYNIKNNPPIYKNRLKGKYIGMLFQKPSLRTKTSFYLAALQLGAQAIYYGPDEVKLGQREQISDVAKTLSQYLDAIVLRTFSHRAIEEFAKYSTVSVINGLSDLLHPSQVLGDLFTLHELRRDFKKIKFSYIGDGNNVCHSLLYAFSILGGNICIAAPRGYEPNCSILEECSRLSRGSGANIYVSNSPQEVAKDADVLYTDVWASMGKEEEVKRRKKIFKRFTIDDKILMLARNDCLVMHCLPAHRGQEIADSVIESKKSVVFLQAANRLYSAKAIILYVFVGVE